MRDLPDYAAENRRYWDAMADRCVAAGERSWAADTPYCGIFQVADDDVPLLPADLDGRDVIELGCGTAYVSAWAARRGARRVVGVDNFILALRQSSARLRTPGGASAQTPLPASWRPPAGSPASTGST